MPEAWPVMRLPCGRAAAHQDNRRFVTEPIERDGGAVFRTYFLHESSPLQPLDVPGYFGQIIAELMPPVTELTGCRAREFLRVHREVRERHHFTIAAVIKEHRQSFGEFRREVFLQCVLFDFPVLGSPVRRRDEEHPGDGSFDLLFGEELQENRSPQRMPDEDDLA